MPTAARITIRSVVAAIFVLGTSIVLANNADIDLPLRFTPTNSSAEDAPALSGTALARTLHLEVKDGRDTPDPALIGDGTNDDDSHFAVRTETNVGTFASEVLPRLATGWGLRLDPTADLTMTVSVVRWFLKHNDLPFGATYDADVTLRGEMVNAAGVTIWRGVAEGDEHRYGKAKSKDNFNEVSSDAVQKAFSKLLSDPALQIVLGGKAPEPEAAATGGAAVTPDELLEQVLELSKKDFSPQFLVDYVHKVTLRPAMTTDDMVKWKDAGVPEAVIAEAYDRGVRKD
jgi:hypothetical protein